MSSLLHIPWMFKEFIGANLDRSWYRLLAFPFRPRRDLAFRGRQELLLAALCFLGGACFWLLMACLVLVLLTFLYDKQLYGIDIVFLVLMALCMSFSFLSLVTVVYLLVALIFWRQRDFIEVRGRRHDPAQITTLAFACAERAWRKTWAADTVDARRLEITGADDPGPGRRHDPARVEFGVGRKPGRTRCTICCQRPYDDNRPAHDGGYTDGVLWVCSECYETFIVPLQKNRPASASL